MTIDYQDKEQNMTETTIYATDHITEETIALAIERSISHTEIVTICAAGEAEISALERECEGSTEDEYVADFWGTNLDGGEWRVQVAR